MCEWGGCWESVKHVWVGRVLGECRDVWMGRVLGECEAV